jgi:hypothetical protein
MMSEPTRQKPHFLRLIEGPEAVEPLAASSFARAGWQNTLFANVNPSLVIIINCESISDDELVSTLYGSRPKAIFDIRRVPRFDIGGFSRKDAFFVFRSIEAQYVDLTSIHRRNVPESVVSALLVSEAIGDTQLFLPKGGPIGLLVDSNQFSEEYITALLDMLPSDEKDPWDVFRLPIVSVTTKVEKKRDVIFISHANPSDNEFATWLAQQLSLRGFAVWCDLRDLKAGDPFWDEIEICIREKCAKVIVVLSKNSQSAPGVLDEIDLSIRVERAESLRRFVLPVRLDGLPYSDVRANLGRKNIIDFSENWASGLKAILEALEHDRVPRANAPHPSSLNLPILDERQRVQVVREPSTLVTNWLLIKSLPEFVYFYDVALPSEQINEVAVRLKTPFFRYLRLLGTFCDAETIQSDLPAGLLTQQYKVPIAEFLSGNANRGPMIKAREASNACVNMLRQAWNREMESRGLSSFTMSSNAIAWYMPLDFLERNVASFTDDQGKKRKKLMVNWSARRKIYWHFAVEARPMLGARPRFVLRQHVIFTADGRTPIASKERMHALRRRFCKSWWNDRWRDLLIGFVSWLNSSGTSFSSGVQFEVEDRLLTLISPLSVVYPDASAISAESLDDEEELSAEDEFDEIDYDFDPEISESSEAPQHE